MSESGMVKHESELDLTALMSFAYTPEAKDSLRQLGEFPIDTLVNMADAGDFNQSEKANPEAEKEFAKNFSKSKLRYIMNDEKVAFIIITDEMSTDAFNNYQKNLEQAFIKYEKADGKGADELKESGFVNILQYKLNGKDFERISLNKKYSIEEIESDSSGLSTKEILNMTQYTFEYHFPKAVKSTTLENATISEDGKTVTATVGMADILEDPEKYNFKVEFK